MRLEVSTKMSTFVESLHLTNLHVMFFKTLFEKGFLDALGTIKIRVRDLFVLIIVFAAFSMAAYKVHAVDGWRHWFIMIGLESLRAILVISNIQIRRINITLSYIALGLSLFATLGLSMMSHFYVVEALAKVELALSPFAASEWWMLQTINALLLFCEWSISVIIAGHLMNWESFTTWIEGDFADHFDKASIDKNIRSWIDRILARIKSLTNFRKEIHSLLDVETDADVFDEIQKGKKRATTIANLNSLTDDQRDEIAHQNKVLAWLIAAGDLVDKDFGKLESESPDLVHLIRLIRIGRRTADRRLSVGANVYEVHCSGQPHSRGVCPVFTMQKSQRSKACPTCGKTHYAQTERKNGTILERIV